ncbi:uncharacterized protein LOC117174147 isoform X2 [Belonocnema kinseyi]|uniref:uncharacterized protein LOC117174147 isoform X2 n=1 Tax=Belonocnema kinseyi TaxID=2817044 RepID=UPI00143D47E6|nr:uncharacterized protein LOC117174147 isoform X2 [Belonocnema kinseyi]
MCLAGLILINDTDDNTRLNMEKIADDTKKMEILMVEESRNPSSHDFGLNAGDEKKHSWSTISIDAISSLDTKHNLETSSINSNRNSPTKIKSHFKRRFAENPYTCEQADYNNIIPTVRSDTIDTIPTEERLANYPQTANALQSKEEDETWGIAEEEKDCINKNVQENIKNIESSTRKKKRHKIILDRTKYSTYSNNEQHFNADNKWWKVLSSGTALPAEKNKIIRKSTRKPFIITCENIRDYQGSSKNDSEIQKQTDQRTQTISHHRNSYNEAGKAMCTEKCIPKFEQDSELSKNIVMNKFNSDFKKEIIPLSNESFIKDLANAQEKYLKRENNLIDSEGAIPCVFYSKINEETIVRKRKSSIIHSESEKKKIIETITRLSAAKLNWFSRLCFFFFQQELPQTSKKIVAKGGLTFKEYHQTYKQPTKGTSFSCSKNQPHQCIAKQLPRKSNSRETILKFVSAFRDLSTEFKKFLEQNPRQVNIIMILRNRCFAELIIIIIYCGFGAFIFRFTEGAFETFYKCGVKRVKRDFLDSLWIYSHNLREEDWKSMARRKLMEFEEQLHVAHDAGVHTYSGKKSWTFSNAVVYCFTVITTIGYGHIAPTTTTGRAVTIVYAIFGIPMFLIILADFGKLFTRGIKFLWAFIRRLYYTGSCREARRTVNVQGGDISQALHFSAHK